MFRMPVLVLTVSLFGVGTHLPAAQPLDSIPDTADVVIRLANPEAAIEKVAELAESVEAGTGTLVRDRAGELGTYISNPSLTGVDQTQDWYVAVFADAEADPVLLFIIPASEADAMQAALPGDMTSMVRDGWVFYSEQGEAVKALADPSNAAGSITAAFDEPSRSLFEESDAALFVNVAHLTTVYEAQILEMQDAAAAGLNEMAFAAPQVEGLNLGAMVDMFGDVLGGLFQALEDARGLTVGVVAEEAGADVKLHLSFESGSATSGFLSNQPASAMPRLAQLPPKSQLYWGAAGNLAGLWQWSQQVMSMLGMAEGSREKLDELSERFDQLEFESTVGSLKVGGEGGGMFQSLSLIDVSPIDAARDAMRGITELAGAIETEGFRQETILERDAEEFGDYSADHVTIEQSFDFGPDLRPEFQQQMEEMQRMIYGPEGNLTRYVYLKDAYVTSQGGGRRAVEDVIGRMESGETNDSGDYRRRLMEEANLLVLVDVPALINGYMGIFAGLGAGLGAPDVPQLDEKPTGASYLGLTAAAESGAVRVQLHVPVEQVRGVLPYVALLQMMTQQQILP